MKGKRLFLQWSLFTSLVVIGTVIGSSLGWFGQVLRNDPTHITLVIIALFVFMTVMCGRLAWQFASGHDPQVIKEKLENPIFAADACVTIGLLGTAIGYFIMMRGASGAEAEAAEQLVRQIKLGMGTVLINTIIGGVCNLLIAVQSHLISQAVERSLRERAEKRAMKP